MRLPVKRHGACGDPTGAEDRGEQFGAAAADEPADAEDLAGVHVQRSRYHPWRGDVVDAVTGVPAEGIPSPPLWPW